MAMGAAGAGGGAEATGTTIGWMSPSRLFIQPMRTPTAPASASTTKTRTAFTKLLITISLEDKPRQVNFVARATAGRWRAGFFDYFVFCGGSSRMKAHDTSAFWPLS